MHFWGFWGSETCCKAAVWEGRHDESSLNVSLRTQRLLGPHYCDNIAPGIAECHQVPIATPRLSAGKLQPSRRPIP